MKAFVAPIYFQTNSISSEKLTGGLLLFSEKKSWLAFSETKINMAEKLVNADIKKLLDHTLTLFQNKIEKINHTTHDKGKELFEFNYALKDDYVNYLSKYSKGIIQFGVPKPIASVPTDEEFEKLFNLYVGEALPTKSKKAKEITFHSIVKDKLNVSGLSEKADIDYEITPELIKGVLKAAHITLITKNGAIEALQAVDFTSTTKTIVDHIYEFEVMVKHFHSFEEEKKLKSGIYKVVVNQPDPKSDQEKLFNNFISSAKGTFHILELDDIDGIVHDILEKPHTRFSEFVRVDH